MQPGSVLFSYSLSLAICVMRCAMSHFCDDTLVCQYAFFVFFKRQLTPCICHGEILLPRLGSISL